MEKEEEGVTDSQNSLKERLHLSTVQFLTI